MTLAHKIGAVVAGLVSVAVTLWCGYRMGRLHALDDAGKLDAEAEAILLRSQVEYLQQRLSQTRDRAEVAEKRAEMAEARLFRHGRASA